MSVNRGELLDEIVHRVEATVPDADQDLGDEDIVNIAEALGTTPEAVQDLVDDIEKDEEGEGEEEGETADGN